MTLWRYCADLTFTVGVWDLTAHSDDEHDQRDGVTSDCDWVCMCVRIGATNWLCVMVVASTSGISSMWWCQRTTLKACSRQKCTLTPTSTLMNSSLKVGEVLCTTVFVYCYTCKRCIYAFKYIVSYRVLYIYIRFYSALSLHLFFLFFLPLRKTAYRWILYNITSNNSVLSPLQFFL